MNIRRVYLDNAASTPLDPQVLQAMLPYLADQFGNPSSIHHHGRQLRAAIEQARKSIAELMGCSPAEIVFTSGGTEADNYAIRSTVAGLGIRHLISSPLEHHAITHTIAEVGQQQGIRVSWLTPDARGNLSLAQLEELLQQDSPAMVSLMHGNNEIGTLNDIQAIAELCKRYGAMYHSDTVQTVGHYRFNLQTLPTDFVVASAHKFHGPKGVGFLFRREGLQLPPLISGGGQERNQRAGTENVACIIGMAKALELAMANLDQNVAHLRSLKNYLKARLKAQMPEVRFNGETDDDNSLPTVLNVALPGTDEESLILFNLDLMGISASGGSACTSGSVVGSHVLSALGQSVVQMANAVRFSFGHQNTQDEIDYLLAQLRVYYPQPV